MNQAIQDQYAPETSVCYGCGRLNQHGLHIKSYVEGEEYVCVFRPKPYHTAIEGFVYGGLIASIIDCHSTGSAAAALAKDRGQDSLVRTVTASLHVDYLAPTPIDGELTVRARAVEVKGRKAVIESVLFAGGKETARGRVVAVGVSADFGKAQR